MATKIPAAGAGEQLSFATLPDDEDWEDVSYNGKPPTPVPPGDSIGPADVTQSWLYTGGDGTASTVKDLRSPGPNAETVLAVREEPSGDPPPPVDMRAPLAVQPKPLETTAGDKTPWDIRREQWMRNMSDCFRYCCAFCLKDKKKN